MVERVADEVHERVAERVDHGAVELGVLTDEHELDLLVELAREVAHEAREAQEDGLHRDHAHLHDHGLQRLRGPGEVLHGLREPGHVGLAHERLDVRALDDELGHVVHEGVEALRVDADGARALLLVVRGLGLVRRGGGRGPLGLAGLDDAQGGGGGWRRDDLLLDDDGLGDVGDVAHGGEQRLVGLRVGPGLNQVALEALELVLLGQRGEDLGVVGHRGEHLEGAHGGHRGALVDVGGHVHDAAPGGELGHGIGRRGDAALAQLHALLGGALAHEPLQALGERGRVQRLLAVGLDVVDRALEGVEAAQQHVDRVAAQADAALAQELEDVLHLVGQRGHSGEAHRRAHALEGVGDPEDLVDRLAVVGLLLDAHDGEVELLEVLARLREEHGQVLGNVHGQPFRYVNGWVGTRPSVAGLVTRSVAPTTR